MEHKRIKVSDFVIQFLEKKGIKNVYTVSGGGCMHLIDSLGKSSVNYFCTHHEQSSAMAAEAHSRIKGYSAVIVTTGPGGTNTITGLLGSWLDSIPVMYISGQVPTSQLSSGTGCRQIGDQEFDIVSVVKGMTKYSHMITDKNEILYHLEKAYDVSKSGRPGPVWIDIPLDIQGDYIDTKDLKTYDHVQQRKPSIKKDKVYEIKESIKSANRPVVVVGSGVRRADAVEKLRNFLVRNRLPVLTGPHSGIDIVNDDYEFYFGRFGVLGQVTSNKIIQKSDLILSLGSRLNVKMTGYDYASFAPDAYKILVDIDKNEMEKFNIIADDRIVCDIGIFLDCLGEDTLTGNIDDWLLHCSEERKKEKLVLDKHRKQEDYTSSYCFVESLCSHLSETTPIVTSDGTAHVVTLKTAKLKGNQRLFTNVGCASMGYGLPAAIGASNALGNKEVVCIEGDGSIQMNIQELQTLVHHNMPLKVFVINNDGYLSIRLTQDSFFDSRYVAIDKTSGVSFPDMKKIASAYGIQYYAIKNNKDLDFTIPKVMSYSKGPVICEVFTDPLEKHEPKVKAKVNEDGSFTPGKLESMTWE